MPRMSLVTSQQRGRLCLPSGPLPAEFGLVLRLSAPRVQAGFANDSWDGDAIGWSGREP